LYSTPFGNRWMGLLSKSCWSLASPASRHESISVHLATAGVGKTNSADTRAEVSVSRRVMELLS
jgi:hypothetical protein